MFFFNSEFVNNSMDAAKSHLGQLGRWCEHFKDYLDQSNPDLNKEQSYELYKNIEAIGVVLMDTVNKFEDFPHLPSIKQDIRNYKNAMPTYHTPHTSPINSQINEISSQLSSLPSPSSQPSIVMRKRFKSQEVETSTLGDNAESIIIYSPNENTIATRRESNTVHTISSDEKTEQELRPTSNPTSYKSVQNDFIHENDFAENTGQEFSQQNASYQYQDEHSEPDSSQFYTEEPDFITNIYESQNSEMVS